MARVIYGARRAGSNGVGASQPVMSGTRVRPPAGPSVDSCAGHARLATCNTAHPAARHDAFTESLNVHQPPDCPHRMGRLRPGRDRVLSALFRDVRPFQRATARDGARLQQARALQGLRLRRLSDGRDASALPDPDPLLRRGGDRDDRDRGAALEPPCAPWPDEGRRARGRGLRVAGLGCTRQGAARPLQAAADPGQDRGTVEGYCATLTPSFWAIAASFLRCSSIEAANSVDVPGLISCEVATKRDFTASSARTARTSAV